MKEKLLKITEIIMLTLTIIILVFFQTKHELWLDELDWSLGIVESGNLKEICKTVLSTGENLPLFYISLFWAKHIFGDNILMLTMFTSTIFTIIGIFGILKVSDEVLEKKNRIFTVFFIFVSYSIMSQCGWQLRPYGLLFCCSAWMLYFYIRKQKENTCFNMIKYVIFMILTMYTHWFGVLISLIYAAIDLVLLIVKKNKKSFIIPYIIAGLAFLPSFILLLQFHQGDIKRFGVDIPSLWNILFIFRFLGGELFFLGIAIFIITITMVVKTILKKDESLLIKIIAWIIFLLITLTYIYSRYINQQGSIIRNRYFTVILPHAIILLGFGGKKLFGYISSNPEKAGVLKFILVFYVILEIVVAYYYILIYHNSGVVSCYKEWAECLVNQEDVYNDDTLIICTYGKTWIDYYFDNDKKVPNNIIGVNPLEIPNMMHMAEEKISDFRFFVKDGKESYKRVTKEEIEKYNVIYYLEEYRTISKEFKNIFKDYEVTNNKNYKIYKLEKINEK